MLNLINMPIRPFVRRMTFAGKALGAAALILTAVACAVDGEEVAGDDGLGDAAEACTMSTEMRDTQSGSVKECSTTRYAERVRGRVRKARSRSHAGRTTSRRLPPR